MGVLSPSAAMRSRHAAANGLQRVVVDFATGDDGNFRIQQIDQPAQDAALGLAAQSQQNEIVPRKQGVDDLRHYRIFVAVHAGEKRSRPFRWRAADCAGSRSSPRCEALRASKSGMCFSSPSVRGLGWLEDCVAVVAVIGPCSALEFSSALSCVGYHFENLAAIYIHRLRQIVGCRFSSIRGHFPRRAAHRRCFL